MLCKYLLMTGFGGRLNAYLNVWLSEKKIMILLGCGQPSYFMSIKCSVAIVNKS